MSSWCGLSHRRASPWASDGDIGGELGVGEKS